MEVKKPLGFETSLSVVRIYPKQHLVVRASRKVITFRSGAVPLESPIKNLAFQRGFFLFYKLEQNSFKRFIASLICSSEQA